MKKYLLLFLIITSCGVRKVQKSETTETTKVEATETVENNIKTSTDLAIITTDNSETITVEPIDTIKPIVINGIAYKNARLKIEKKKVNTNSIFKKIIANNSVKIDKTNTIKDLKVITKATQRVSNYWWLLWLLLIPIGYYAWQKYKTVL